MCVRRCDINLLEVDEVSPSLPVLRPVAVEHQAEEEEESGRLNPAILETPACLKIQSAYKLPNG